MNQTVPGWFLVFCSIVFCSISVAAVRAEFASSVSAHVSQSDTAPASR